MIPLHNLLCGNAEYVSTVMYGKLAETTEWNKSLGEKDQVNINQNEE